MSKVTAAQKRANLKYRKYKTKQLRIQYKLLEYRKIEAYCLYIKSPIGTWVKSLIKEAIDSDKSFIYNPPEIEKDIRED